MTPTTYDRRASDRPEVPPVAAPPAADPAGDTPTVADVKATARTLRWLVKNAGWLLGLAGTLVVGYGARSQQDLEARSEPALLDSVRAVRREFRAADSQLRIVDDTSRAERAVTRRMMEYRTEAIAAGVCLAIPPERREGARLPCASLLAGGRWPLDPLP